MPKIYDLSHPITNEAPCTFGIADKVPTVTFEEGDSHGLYFVTSRIDNLYSNAGTQIDFPAHLAGAKRTTAVDRKVWPTVGAYPLERFIGKAAVLDFSPKMALLDGWFNDQGVFLRDRMGEFNQFVDDLKKLEISVEEYRLAVERTGVDVAQLTGVILYSGSGRFWTHNVFESWEYRYFYAPYFSVEASQLIADTANISFVGVDAFQIEDPVANFRGDELPLMVNSAARLAVLARLKSWEGDTNHERLLGNGVLIYESMALPPEVAGRVGDFSGVPLNLQLNGLDDDAVTRPYIVI